MNSITEYDHLSKMKEEKFSLPPLLLTLAELQTFRYSVYHKKKTGTTEHLLVFLLTSVCHLGSSLTNLWQRLRSSIGSAGFIIPSNILRA